MPSGIPRVAETLVSVGFDAAFFDLQHGEVSFAEARDAMAAVRGCRQAVRRPGRSRGLCRGGAALDVGAELAIMPMVNSVEDARKLVDTLKYPPLGSRSWGPTRSHMLGMATEAYRATRQRRCHRPRHDRDAPAVDALEDILDVPGLDGVFVGPSDLSISLTEARSSTIACPKRSR